jgi:rhomboid family GlyGly-CTERM serine protease
VPSSADGSRAWVGLAALLAAGACLSSAAATGSIDWQPALAWREPWRAWTAAFLHFSALHLGANLAGVALVAAFGFVARVPRAGVVAWAVAWPLTQLGLLARPDLLHYGGLSGVLHAGVAIGAVFLIVEGRGRRRLVGVATAALLAAKVVGESPWGEALRHPPGWDMALAPAAHASGLLAGLATAAAAALVRRGSRRSTGAEAP